MQRLDKGDSIARDRELGDTFWVAADLFWLGATAFDAGDLKLTVSRWEEMPYTENWR